MPYQAIVETNGNVLAVIVCDEAGADVLAGFDPYPGCTWHEVTDITPRPAPGWLLTGGDWVPPTPTTDEARTATEET